jgi:hypothetical protein
MAVREHQRRLAEAVGGGEDWPRVLRERLETAHEQWRLHQKLEAAHERWATSPAFVGKEESERRFQRAALATGITIVEVDGEG